MKSSNISSGSKLTLPPAAGAWFRFLLCVSIAIYVCSVSYQFEKMVHSVRLPEIFNYFGISNFHARAITAALLVCIGTFTPSNEFSIDDSRLILTKNFIWGKKIIIMKSTDIKKISINSYKDDSGVGISYYMSVYFRNGSRYDSREYSSRQDALDLSSKVHAALLRSHRE